MEPAQNLPDCTVCRHFLVTWEAANPRACKAYGFKTKELPSQVVLRESGLPCGLFEPKARPQGTSPDYS